MVNAVVQALLEDTPLVNPSSATIVLYEVTLGTNDHIQIDTPGIEARDHTDP